MNLWFISDTHFGHENIWRRFKIPCPTCKGIKPPEVVCSECADLGEIPMRPFTSTEEMDRTMIDRWNVYVKPSDHIYHLGDFTMKRHLLRFGKALNGHKRIVRGNHDIFKTKEYVEAGFEEVYGVRVIDNMLMTHIPVHPKSLGRFSCNMHGHIHNNQQFDPPYLNVCVEVTDYRPLSMEEVRQIIKGWNR